MAFSFRPAFSFGFSHRHAFRIQIPWRLTDRQLLESSSNELLTLGMRHVYECRMDFFYTGNDCCCGCCRHRPRRNLSSDLTKNKNRRFIRVLAVVITFLTFFYSTTIMMSYLYALHASAAGVSAKTS
jgi:hypothetical protein